MARWNITYDGPGDYFDDRIDGLRFQRGRTYEVSDEVKVRLTENTAKPIYKDVWRAETAGSGSAVGSMPPPFVPTTTVAPQPPDDEQHPLEAQFTAEGNPV